MTELSGRYTCKECSKIYKSYKSLWNHNKKFHTSDVVLNTTNVVSTKKMSCFEVSKTVENLYDNTYCKYCKKKFCDRKYRWKHEKICKLNKNEIVKKELDVIKKENAVLRDSNAELRDLVKQLLKNTETQNDLLKSIKIHPKQLQKINNQLNNDGIINNGNINIQLVQLGQENINELLSDNEKIKILNHMGNSVRELFIKTHLSDKFPQFKNVYITNLQNSIGYKFDNKTNNFIAVNKNDLIDEIIDCRMYDIETFLTDLENEIDENVSKVIKKFITRMNNEDDKLKGIKKEEIKLLLYNSRDKLIPKKELEI